MALHKREANVKVRTFRLRAQGDCNFDPVLPAVNGNEKWRPDGRCQSSVASVSADDNYVPAELPMTDPSVSEDLATIAEKNVRVRFCALWCAKYASDNGYTGNACCAVKCAPRVPAQPAAPRARPRMNPQRDRTAAFGRTTPAPRSCARSPTTATHEESEDTRRSLLR